MLRNVPVFRSESVMPQGSLACGNVPRPELEPRSYGRGCTAPAAGRSNQKRLPPPGAASYPTVPPIRLGQPLQRARTRGPCPEIPLELAQALERLEQLPSLVFGDARPGVAHPEADSPALRWRATDHVSAAAVYLMALPTGSCRGPGSGAAVRNDDRAPSRASTRDSIERSAARGPTTEAPRRPLQSSTSRRETHFPVSTREISRISSISWRRCRPPRGIWSTLSSCSGPTCRRAAAAAEARGCVERRAQLVTDPRQELALRHVRSLRVAARGDPPRASARRRGPRAPQRDEAAPRGGARSRLRTRMRGEHLDPRDVLVREETCLDLVESSTGRSSLPPTTSGTPIQLLTCSTPGEQKPSIRLCRVRDKQASPLLHEGILMRAPCHLQRRTPLQRRHVGPVCRLPTARTHRVSACLVKRRHARAVDYGTKGCSRYSSVVPANRPRSSSCVSA